MITLYELLYSVVMLQIPAMKSSKWELFESLISRSNSCVPCKRLGAFVFYATLIQSIQITSFHKEFEILKREGTWLFSEPDELVLGIWQELKSSMCRKLVPDLISRNGSLNPSHPSITLSHRNYVLIWPFTSSTIVSTGFCLAQTDASRYPSSYSSSRMWSSAGSRAQLKSWNWHNASWCTSLTIKSSEWKINGACS